MMSNRFAISIAVAVLLLVPVLAHADDKAAAERYFRAGARAYAAQNFQAAATNFDEAFKSLPMPEIGFSAAQAYRKLYQIDPKPEYVRRAIELFENYLANVKTGGRVGDAADNLLDMKREWAKLEAAGVKTQVAAPAAPKTRLGVNVSLPDQASSSDAATLREIGDSPVADAGIKGLVATIDGNKVDPFTLVDVAAKDHVIKVAADGYFPVEKKTVAVEGQSALVDVELKPMPAKVKVATESDAKILVDGRAAATAPAAPIELKAGKHLLTVLHRGREPFATEVSLTRGQELALDASLRKTSRRRAVPYILAGAGLLAVGALTTALVANARDNHADDLRMQIQMGNRPPGDDDAYDAAVKSRDKFVAWTWALGGAAVVAGGTGTLLFFFDAPSADSATVGVSGHF